MSEIKLRPLMPEDARRILDRAKREPIVFVDDAGTLRAPAVRDAALEEAARRVESAGYGEIGRFLARRVRALATPGGRE